jgi:Mce-associated membrane protein
VTLARQLAWWTMVVMLAAATCGAVALGGWQILIKSQSLPANQVAAREAAMKAASDGSVAVLSYSPDHLQEDFSAAESKLTGDFLNYYKQFTSQVVAPAAQQKQVTTTAKVEKAGVESLTSTSAAVLIFVNQSTTTKEKPEPTAINSAVRVGLTRVSGKWLINRFDPV